MNLQLLLADAAAEPVTGGDMTTQTISMVLWMAVLLGAMYFLMIRPQKKKEREQKNMRDNLQIGDEVTTVGGITGIIVRKTEDTVVIETGGDRNKVRVKIWAISENATVHDVKEDSASSKNEKLPEEFKKKKK